MKNICSKLVILYKEKGLSVFITVFMKGMYYLTVYPLMQIMEHIPIRVRKKRILFSGDGHISDNAKAVFDYVLRQEQAKEYTIIWLVNEPKKYAGQYPDNVKLVREKYKLAGCRTLSAYYYARTSEKLMFTHTLNWVKRRSKEQLFLNLWHGCGYKAAKADAEPIRFDYCLVPGDLFVETKAAFFQCERSKILPWGYPRYDALLSDSPAGQHYIEQWKKDSATKVIIWMPTFRKATHANLTDNSLDNNTDIPLMDSIDALNEFDRFCRASNTVILLKRHHLERRYLVRDGMYSIKMIDDDALEAAGVQLYDILQYTDGLISDYSSIAIDYLLLDKPIGFVLQDYERYKELRGFVFDDPMEYMPGEKIYKMQELQEFIKKIHSEEDNYKKERERIRSMIHGEISTDYCKKIVEYFGV